jgi:hypothetical protein
MLRKTMLLLVVISFVVFGVAADGKKPKPKGSGSSTTTTVAGSTTTISASEGTTMQAIRGIVEPGDGAAVIGFAAGVVTARDRVSGRAFKFNVPPTSNIHIGDNVVFSSGFAQISGVSGRFPAFSVMRCCVIDAIHAADHTAVVRERSVGRTFVMKFASGPPLEFRVGAPVAADFKSGKAWLPSNVVLKWQITNLSQPNGLHP